MMYDPEYRQLKQAQDEAFIVMTNAQQEYGRAQEQLIWAESKRSAIARSVTRSGPHRRQYAKRRLTTVKRELSRIQRACRSAESRFVQREREYRDVTTALCERIETLRDEEQLIAIRAGVPLPYLPHRIKVKYSDGECHIYFGGRDGVVGAYDGHGHIIININGIRYWRDPGAPHGPWNHINPARAA